MRRILTLAVAVVSGACLANAALLTNGDLDFADARTGKRGNVLSGLTGGATPNDRWDTFSALPDGTGHDSWTATPAEGGMDVLDGGVIPGVEPHSGIFYVELDSDTGDVGQCVGCNTNSTMSQGVLLNPGHYLLSFYYRARPDVTPVQADDFQVSAYLDDFSTLLVTASATTDLGWTLYTANFWISTADSYDIIFRAEGYENEYGGLIDTISLEEIPEPATYALVGAGLVGLFLVRRRRRKA